MGFDPQNMKQSIYEFPDHMGIAMEIGKKIRLKRNYSSVRNIVVTGMGGSAIGGDVTTALMFHGLKVPFRVNRHYNLPSWVDESTLVICSSYSGNTEETLSAFKDAVNRGAMVMGITTGGMLEKMLRKYGFEYITIPSGLQPRAALAFSFIPMIYLGIQAGFIEGSDPTDELNKARSLLESVRDQYSKELPENPTYKLARAIYGTLPVIYGESETTGIAAVRWKGQLAENSKMLAYCNDLPELNHNEIVGWENNPDLLKSISVIWLLDPKSHTRVIYRQRISENIINSRVAGQYMIEVTGSNTFSRFLHLIHYGDWVSYWCAIAHGTDPTPVHKIDRLKKELSQRK
ncbi:MAG: bifunctional phosphoglucose/phosphomannose isomerase [FCB group bacterium]|nr:bifunctional phosphoglucose/phosphomannose isomerase [FCB group bacterium]